MVKCQRSGCDEKATHAIQMMEPASIWPGVCKEHALEYVDSVGGDINDYRWAVPIRDAEWFPRRISHKMKMEIEDMVQEVKSSRKKGADL